MRNLASLNKTGKEPNILSNMVGHLVPKSYFFNSIVSIHNFIPNILIAIDSFHSMTMEIIITSNLS